MNLWDMSIESARNKAAGSRGQLLADSDVPRKCRDHSATGRDAMHTSHQPDRRLLAVRQLTRCLTVADAQTRFSARQARKFSASCAVLDSRSITSPSAFALADKSRSSRLAVAVAAGLRA